MTLSEIAKNVFNIEAAAIAKLSEYLTVDFDQAVYSIQNSKGKLIISGMGKSGLIGKKIAATLASTGTPSFFLHPAEAYHGDLGMIEPNDIVLLLSYSGETDEILRLMPFLKNQKNIIISMSGNPNSTLAKNSNYHLNISVEKEACPLKLAPTSSTTATLVMGDALAVALMNKKEFKDENFAKFHPGGTLGRRLITTVSDVMQRENLPICKPRDSIKDVISQIGIGKLGLVVVIEQEKTLGIITDGDIRRAMDTHESNFFGLLASDLCTSSPKTINADSRLTKASDKMTENKINTLLVTNNQNKLIGIIQMYDLGI
ncbi:MAG: KpsF/GutQ family sugar-phosphate isomerase [Sulfurovum sp.]|nr:KpsF/GutQ family sugar-phosphate isomerase [Sulfurovum sp.]